MSREAFDNLSRAAVEHTSFIGTGESAPAQDARWALRKAAMEYAGSYNRYGSYTGGETVEGKGCPKCGSKLYHNEGDIKVAVWCSRSKSEGGDCNYQLMSG